MNRRQRPLIVAAILLVATFAACSSGGDKVHRTYLGPERSDLSLVTLQLGSSVKSVTIGDRTLPRSEYGTLKLVPGQYTLVERDDASITFTIRPVLVDRDKARASGQLLIGHTYTLHAGKSKATGRRALWVEDSRNGDVFIDTR